MTKEDYLKKRAELDEQYLRESGIIGKMFLNYYRDVYRGGEEIWVEVYKVTSLSIEGGEIYLKSSDFHSITKYINEDEKISYEIEIIRDEDIDKTDVSSDLGFALDDKIDVEIDEGDYKKILDIIVGGDSDMSPEQRFNDLCEYLNRCGFVVSENEERD